MGLLSSLVGALCRAQALKKVGFRGCHSSQLTVSNPAMKVKILPALSDNYMFLLVDEQTKEAAIVDPVNPQTVAQAVTEEGVQLTTILTTHHHWDHNGGNSEMVKMFPSLTVLGGDQRIDGLTKSVGHGDKYKVGSLNIECLATPCHTTGHICYFVQDAGSTERLVFTGDTLFLGGCGRFFEGTADQMYAALIQKLGSLPDDTKVYCGHEYALQNLAFGKHVEPDNKDVLDKIQWVKERRESNPPLPSIPSTIEEEKRINPFMRVEVPSVQEFTKESEPIAVMKSLRATKDNFKAK